MKFLRVNMTERTVKEEEVQEKYSKMGGRHLTSCLVADEVPPLCHALGPNNKIVIAPGVVTGTSAPSSGRLSVGGKSPLTGGIKESNAGTPFSQRLGRLGIKAIIIEGLATEGLWMLKVDKDGAELISAENLKGKGMYETADTLFKEYPLKNSSLMGIGPSGEKRMAMAGISFNDPEGRPSRYAGRGGLGAVLGSKGLKAIVVNDAGAPGVSIQNIDLFKQGQKKLVEAIRTHDLTKPGGALNSFGTAILINVLNEVGGLPTRNFSSGQFKGASKTSGESIAEKVKERGGAGMMGHGCHPGCIIRCSNVYPAADGSEIVSCVEYESDWAFGANCEIDDLDTIAKLIYHCNDIGLDTIEAGVTVGLAMEAGVISFGDGNGAIDLLDQIRTGTSLGHILGNGAEFTGKAYGLTRIPTVKRQAMPAYEPRAVKGIGTTYITSPMGADHTAGYTITTEILSVGGQADPLDPKGKVELSKAFQTATAFIDASGYCLFIAFPILDISDGMEGMVETINGVLGTNWTVSDVGRIGMDILSIENDFNAKAGFSKEDDRPPEFMRYEPLPPHNVVFDITDEELDKIWK
ncbi:MAG: aldehyde ferredoxin oxidoreductase C-terminal domain-containing protein [Bacillota bacterium]|nr:aldehyde ferredoxin oxidoreductase C-terminal domain-containing protein [Bacillota bacterium]